MVIYQCLILKSDPIYYEDAADLYVSLPNTIFYPLNCLIIGCEIFFVAVYIVTAFFAECIYTTQSQKFKNLGF